MKRENIEKMLEGIDDKYISQAQESGVKHRNVKAGIAVAVLVVLVGAVGMYGGMKNQTQKVAKSNIFTGKDMKSSITKKIDTNNNITKEENTKKNVATEKVEIKENDRLSLAVKKGEKSEEVYKGMIINEGDYRYGMESSTPGIPLIVTGKVDGATLHIKNENGQIMIEKDQGTYEVLENNGEIESGKIIFWRPDKNSKYGSEVVVTLYKEKKIIGGIVVDIKSTGTSTYTVEYVGNIEIKNGAESMQSTLNTIKTVIHDMERDLERNAVPKKMLKDTKTRLKEYRKFFEKYEQKIKRTKNKEELYSEFLIEYNKMLDKFDKHK